MIRRLYGVALASCFFAAAAVPAQAADSCVNTDGSGGCFTTISAAVANVATVDGDTITVAAGTYNENQILVNKGVEIVGAGMGKTVVDGNAGSGISDGTFRFTGNVDQGLRDVTIRDSGGPSAGQRTAIGIKTLAPAELVFDGVEIIGRGAGGNDYGIYADNTTADIEFANGRITGTAFNPLLIELHRGGLDVHDSFISSPSSIFFMAYGGNNVTAPQRITDNEIVAGNSGISVNGSFGGGGDDGRFTDFEITGNDISSAAGTGIALSNGSGDPSGANGELADFVVSDNRIVSSAPSPVAASRGIRLAGGVTGAQITGNTVSGFETGLRFDVASAGHSQDGTVVHFNRIAGNTTPVLNPTSNPIDAEHNWWGCNAGPGNAGCGSFTGAGTTDGTPWLVLRATATPVSIQTGGQTSAITADLTRDSAGATPASNTFPDGTTIGFATTLGTVGPVSSATTAAAAGSTLTSGATAGTATVTATLDNQSVTTPVEFTTPPPVDNGNGSGTGGGGTGTVPPPTTPGGQTEPPAAATLSLASARTVKIDRRGRFTLTATAGGPGILVARGTAKAGDTASRRLVGKRQRVTGGAVKVQLRLARSTRLALLRGERTSATVSFTLTPPREGAAAAKSITVRVTR